MAPPSEHIFLNTELSVQLNLLRFANLLEQMYVFLLTYKNMYAHTIVVQMTHYNYLYSVSHTVVWSIEHWPTR
jgi:hypothetical protein